MADNAEVQDNRNITQDIATEIQEDGEPYTGLQLALKRYPCISSILKNRAPDISFCSECGHCQECGLHQHSESNNHNHFTGKTKAFLTQMRKKKVKSKKIHRNKYKN